MGYGHYVRPNPAQICHGAVQRFETAHVRAEEARERVEAASSWATRFAHGVHLRLRQIDAANALADMQAICEGQGFAPATTFSIENPQLPGVTVAPDSAE